MDEGTFDALIVLADPIRPTIVSLAEKTRIPAIYQISSFVILGGLASYGPDLHAMYRRAAQYVDIIFKGANPAKIPIRAARRFELALNLKTAASLGLTIPDNLMVRVDKVIE